MGKKIELFRAAFVHLLFFIYLCVLFWRLGLILDTTHQFTRVGTISSGIAVCVVFLIIEILLIKCAVFKR